MQGAITVAGLFLHPVKSCRGIAVARATLDPRGFVGDRRFLVVDETGRFLTQRDTPALARITPTVTDDRLALARPGAAAIRVTLPPPGAPTASRAVVIWRDTVRAVDLGDEAAAWLRAALDRPARLVGIGPEFSRPIREETAHAGDEIAFADAHPLLVLSEASLDDLNTRLDFPLPMNRFRPNLVVRGATPYAEDTWRRIRVGSVVLRASGPCARCVITTTDQATLERGKEPLRTLATYRRGIGGEVNFGQNYIHETKSGTIAVGDTIEILS